VGDGVNRYRVLHLITRLELGGAQQNTLFCAAHHDRRHFEVELLAGEGGLLDAEARAIPDARVELLPYLKHPVSPFWDAVALLKLRAYFKARRIDLVHTHSSKAGIVGRAAALLAGVPAVVHTIHGWSFNPTQPTWARAGYVALERAAAGVTDRLIAVSAANREAGIAKRIGRPERYVVLHSGIDAEKYRTPRKERGAVRRELGFDDSHTVVGTVACLKPQKAPLDFLHAAAAAHERKADLRFFIAGDGELRPRLEARILELGLQRVVRLLGWRRDVADLLHAMDIFLLTSRFEGLPRAVLQAMAAGVPVVATAVDGTPEVVRDGASGLLVPPSAPEAAARRLLELAEDEALRRRCVEQGRRRVDASFDIRGMVRELDRLYLSLLESPQRRSIE
jgi:glycosyltransferase involved in cell wall biosynthesis